MPFKSHAGVSLRHTFSIIDHLDQCTTGVLYIHLNVSGAGIHRIFYQLLYDRGWTLDNLARRYLIGNTVRK